MDEAALLRLAAFASALALLAGLESAFAARGRALPRCTRWLSNLTLGAAGAVLGRLMGPFAALGAAALAEAHGFGLLRWAGAPEGLAFVAAVAALDLAVWAQHLASHRIGFLWRLHAVHHADADLDVTTGLRFHPLEHVLSHVWKAVVVALLGAPVAAVVAFEIALNLGSMFNHANLRLPAPFDAALRLVVVTPAMHAVHHAPARADHDSNYGFTLSLWDRLFGTYRAEAASQGIGLDAPRGAETARLGAALLQPFARRAPA